MISSDLARIYKRWKISLNSYLGHVVSAEGVVTNPTKVATICKGEAFKIIKALQAFLGMAGYYRQYIPDFTTIAKPLTRLIGGDNRQLSRN